MPAFPLRYRLAALLAATLATPAHAAEPGWYAGLLLGSTGQSDQTLTFEGTPAERGTADFSSDFLSGGSIGYRFGNGWRIEGEFVYQSTETDRRPFRAPALQGDGNYASTGFAVNTLYEFDLFGSPKARTYLGAGLVALTEVDIDFETPSGERSYSGDDIAMQVLAGVRYDIGSDWFLDLGVRQLRASGLRLDGEGSSAGVIRGDYAPWAVTFGAGWYF